MSSRLSSCSLCSRALLFAARPSSSARLLHSSPILSRGPQSTRSSKGATNLGRPLYGRSTPPWQRSKAKSAANAPVPTLAVGLLKLQQHIQQHWKQPTAEMDRLAAQLGVGSKRLSELAAQFAPLALADLSKVANSTSAGADSTKGKQRALATTWDVDRFFASYKRNAVQALRDSTLSAFVVWAASLRSTFSTAPADALADPTLSKLQQLARTTDIRFAGELYPDARQIRRKLILHVGPTNSGKTHQALVALARARTGAYAGPLRLLAHEVFSRFNEGKIGDEGKRACNLVTGEEQRVVDIDAGLESCTVEMFPISKRLDVGVIDEIQMIGDAGRGVAWTQAVLGAQCAELHLCGEESVVELIQTMARELGDECIVKRYQRLSPLAMAANSLGGDVSKIKKGDCLVTFSRNNIFAFKRTVEQKTGLRVAVAYGGLPPEVREEQARVFNEGGYDVLVASDAVGMGLNLKINRIVFESLHKWDGKKEVQLPIPQIKQIAGRAGRFGIHTKNPDPEAVAAIRASTSGEATCLDESDMPILMEALATPTIPVTQAYHAAPTAAFKQVYEMLPAGTSISEMQTLVTGLTRVAPHYVAPSPGGSNEVLDAIEHVGPLTFTERMLFGYAPVNLRDDQSKKTLVDFVQFYARGEAVLMSRWARNAGVYAALDSVEEARAAKASAAAGARGSSSNLWSASAHTDLFNSTHLAKLESFHRCLTLYLWLSYRLSSIFCDAEHAAPLRKELESAIEFTLEEMKFERIDRKAKRKAQFHALLNEGRNNAKPSARQSNW